jgi:hypothetical protein
VQRVEQIDLVFDRPTPIRLDGRVAGTATHVRIDIEPEALDVVV